MAQLLPRTLTPKHTFARGLSRRRLAAILAGISAGAVIACGGGGSTPAAAPGAAEAHAASSQLQRTPTPAAVPLAKVVSSQDDLNRARLLMIQSFNFFTGPNVVAIQEIGELGVQESIIPLVELTRFSFEDYTITQLGDALENLTGESFGGSNWEAWYRWLGEHPEIDPLPGYVTWKGDIYSNIDERFETFFEETIDTRIPIWGIQWGGVALDGIPPLETPRVIRGDEAGYLRPDDPVFGAVVNGEARAYPWRLMASHELANDVIQGKPVAVVF